ncbi:hypothetical protein MP228_004252 [Amoeboaphelidium protococcarum]|nr:hypothetical protein MP228_004252 [Amoeboaphelidium protococcarum]
MDAAHLAKECRIAYGWSRRDSAFYVSEILNFWMPLKAYAGDFDGTIISPPEIIDQVWHVALLDTKEYSDHCLRVLRVPFIHHSSKRAYDDQRTLAERRQNTLALFDQKWPGERDVSVWNFPSDRAAAHFEQDARRSKRLKSASKEWICVRIMTLTGASRQISFRVYNWNRRDSAYYVSEFLNYWMPLKAYADDCEATKLHPPKVIDQVWLIAILDTQEYEDHCHKLLNVPIMNYSSKRAYDEVETLRDRQEITIALFDQKWPGERDESVWSFPTNDDENTPPAQTTRRSKRLKSGASEKISFIVKTLTGKSIAISLKQSSTVERLKCELFLKEGIPTRQQRLIFSGRQLEDPKTLQDYHIENDSVLHLVLRLLAC